MTSGKRGTEGWIGKPGEPMPKSIPMESDSISKTIETIEEAFARGVAYGRAKALAETLPDQQKDELPEKIDDLPPLEAAMRDQVEAQKRGDTFGEIRAMIRVCVFVPALCREIEWLRAELAEVELAKASEETKKSKSNG